MKQIRWISILLLLPALGLQAQPNGLSATEIVKRADEKMRGLSNQAEMKMTIVRPTWQREVQMKSWSKGDDYSLILITAPARDAGMGFLKRGNEIWNWQPSIDRTIKLPPSMMMQSWMGSDFTNDDLVKQSSVVTDYTHKLLGSEKIDGRDAYKIELIPKENAAVVWGKVISWIDKTEFVDLKVEFYDEEGELVNTMYGKNIKKMDDRVIPAIMEIIPADKPGNKTIIEYLSIDFGISITEDFFSVQNLKRIRP